MSSDVQQQVFDDKNNDSPKTNCSDSNMSQKEKQLIETENKEEKVQIDNKKEETLNAESIIEEQSNQQQQTQDQQSQTHLEENNIRQEDSVKDVAPNQPVQGNNNDAMQVENDNIEQVKLSDNGIDKKLKEQQEMNDEIDVEGTCRLMQQEKQNPKYKLKQNKQPFQPQQIIQEKQQQEDSQLLEKLTYQQKQQLQEIQYYVYQDLANVLGILTDTTETIKHFQNVKDQTYVPIAINKLVLQANLSNAIHYDCGFQYKDQGLKEMYIREKQHANQIFDEFYKQFDIQNDGKIKECVELFKYNLSKDPGLKQATALPVDVKAKFNQAVVQKIFDGMNTVSQTMDKIKEGEYKKLQKEDFAELVQQRRENAQLLLNQNFPQNCHGQQQPQKKKADYH